MSSPEAPLPCAVLVVDDDVSFTAVVVDTLRERGCEPETAHDHSQAMDRLSYIEYAVAVIDLVLPGLP